MVWEEETEAIPIESACPDGEGNSPDDPPGQIGTSGAT